MNRAFYLQRFGGLFVCSLIAYSLRAVGVSPLGLSQGLNQEVGLRKLIFSHTKLHLPCEPVSITMFSFSTC